VKPEELEAALAKGEIGPLYYLYGDEPYLIDRATRLLLERLVDPSSRDFNLSVYYGTECKGEDILDTAQTMPMFADWRVVLVKRGQSLSQASLDLMFPYLLDPSPTTCLIIQGEKIDQRKKFFTEFKKRGKLVECKRPYENQLAPFLRSEAAGHGKKLAPAAAELLIYLAGNNLQELATQIEKVALFAGQRETITIEDVKAVVSDTKVDSVFELANALGAKDLATALRRLKTILRDGEAPLMVLAMITRHFRQLWQVRVLLDKRVPEQEISRQSGINPYFLKGVVKQAGNFRPVECRQLFERFFAADLAMKSGGRPPSILEDLVLATCQRNG